MQTALLREGPDESLGHILEQEHAGLYEQDCDQVWGYNYFPLSNKPWNFMSNLGFHTGGSPIKGNQGDEDGDMMNMEILEVSRGGS